MKAFGKRELFVAIGFTIVSALAHLVWNPIIEYWQLIVTTLVFVSVLSFWLVKEWRGLQLFMTKFYCVAVIFDILAEGILQPFHRCTLNNILCTGRMFLVFFAFWLILHPAERWLAARSVSTR
jgi:hypothetical protein